MRRVPFRLGAALAALAACLVAIPSVLSPLASARETRLEVRDAADAVRAELPAPGTRAFLGVVTTPASGGLRVARVIAGSASDRGGLRPGDVLRSLGDASLAEPGDLDRALADLVPGHRVDIAFVRDRVLMDRSLVIGGRRERDSAFRGGLFRLAVVPVLFADDAGAAAPPRALERFFFAESGRRGAGASLADYFAAQSLGSLRVGGRVLDPVRLKRARAAYEDRPMGSGSGTLFSEAAARLAERDGAAALRDIDGLVFLHAGSVETRPGRALWPHRAAVALDGRRLPYYVHSVATVGGGEIGEHCHEFAHLLGLPDEYGVGHLTGSGDFCLMGIGHRGGGETGTTSPFSLCASCRVRLGWLPTVVVDPRIAQRLSLRPAHVRGARAVVVPLDSGTQEYLLLEARARTGFDAELPSAGLLVWRVGGVPTEGQAIYGNPVDLIEAHGIDTFEASSIRTGEIAFPTGRARDLTPDTVPSSSSGRAGAFPVHLTDIERLPGGGIAFTIGVRRRVTQLPPAAPSTRPIPADGVVRRVDPVTGKTVVFEVGPRSVGARSEGRDSR